MAGSEEGPEKVQSLTEENTDLFCEQEDEGDPVSYQVVSYNSVLCLMWDEWRGTDETLQGFLQVFLQAFPQHLQALLT